MSSIELTNMGGDGEAFPSTNWRDLSKLKKADRQVYEALINHLISSYWKPIYCFLRKKGYSNHTAKDLTQDFFYEIVLKKDLFQEADQEKGRLRTFLLKCLNNYTANYHRKERLLKNRPNQSLLRLDHLEEPSNLLAAPDISPECAYQISWVQQLVQESIQTVQQHFVQNGQSVHWQLFEMQFLFPITERSSRPTLKSLCKQYNLKDEKQVSNMLTTVKRAFRRVFYEKMASSLENPSDLEMEIKDILNIFE